MASKNNYVADLGMPTSCLCTKFIPQIHVSKLKASLLTDLCLIRLFTAELFVVSFQSRLNKQITVNKTKNVEIIRDMNKKFQHKSCFAEFLVFVIHISFCFVFK